MGISQEGWKPAKYFSIDRVFRNEAMDATHLCEFHQIEGLICDKYCCSLLSLLSLSLSLSLSCYSNLFLNIALTLYAEA
jgi:phenylalanyl-tRNA synthetase alpha subunit